MKKIILALACALALAAPASGAVGRDHHAAVYLGTTFPSETMCTPATNPPCQFIVNYPTLGVTRTYAITTWHSRDFMCGNWYTMFTPDCNSFSWNVGVQGDGGASNVRVQVWARQRCPISGGYYYSDLYEFGRTSWHVVWDIPEWGNQHLHIWTGPGCYLPGHFGPVEPPATL